ncbi:hypothetical protein BofuT4_P142740.1 [Botrytis cinerea T4]|uniref:Uncharacterized protein n=1 Tax=Botryotinia fuckeliana (strain T4) TaxID=999810 RepID=G2YZG4_BOTF4|nr:hypothetical protein BofuT4_P142740.1 [Botrytis cinerea T4]
MNLLIHLINLLVIFRKPISRVAKVNNFGKHVKSGGDQRRP